MTPVSRPEIRAGMQEREQFATTKLLSRFVTYELGVDVADRAGGYLQQSRTRGVALSVPNAIIAATAIPHGLTFVTFNPKDFAMPGLSLLRIAPSENG
jgi:predicted nucleic acid-binding protein